MAIADGKVFITTYQGTYAYNALNGQFIWGNDNAAAIGAQVYNGSVYVGVFGSVVYRLDENTGVKILSYQAPAASNTAWKGTPIFVVADGKVFATSSDGIAVFDANSGGLYWTIGGLFNYPFYPYPQPTLGELNGSENPSNYIYILYGGRVDANNGKMLWNTGNHVASNYIISENKVIFWNFWLMKHTRTWWSALTDQVVKHFGSLTLESQFTNRLFTVVSYFCQGRTVTFTP
jgi:outer membrane protein assembly factor BamB